MKAQFIIPLLSAILFFGRANMVAQLVHKTEYSGPIQYRANNQIFQFPKQTFIQDGKIFEANTTVTYVYNKEYDEYEHLILEIKVLPLDVEGFPVDLRDSIAKYARAGTAIRQIKVFRRGGKVKFKGSAEMYTTAVSVKSDNRDAQAKLKYSVTFDCARPEVCSAKFKIVHANWDEPDKREHVAQHGTYFSDDWRPELHYMGYNMDFYGYDSIYVMKPIILMRIPNEEKEGKIMPMLIKPKKIYVDIWWSAVLPIPFLRQHKHLLPVVLRYDGTLKDGRGHFFWTASHGRSLKVCAANSLLCSPRNKFAFMDQNKSTWIDYRMNIQGDTYKRDDKIKSLYQYNKKDLIPYMKNASITILLHY